MELNLIPLGIIIDCQRNTYTNRCYNNYKKK